MAEGFVRNFLLFYVDYAAGRTNKRDAASRGVPSILVSF